MKTYKNEAALVADIWNQILRSNPTAYLIKIHGGMYQESGIPDLMMCIDGLLVGIEVKHQKKTESLEHAIERTTQKQRIHIARIVKAGGMAGVALSVDDAMHILQLARLKQRMINRGAPIAEHPLPKYWDQLMKPNTDKIVPYTETSDHINPAPPKKHKEK